MASGVVGAGDLCPSAWMEEGGWGGGAVVPILFSLISFCSSAVPSVVLVLVLFKRDEKKKIFCISIEEARKFALQKCFTGSWY